MPGAEKSSQQTANSPRLLKRANSQFTLGFRHTNDNGRRINHSLLLASTSCSNLFTKPFSSSINSSQLTLRRSVSFHRPQTSLPFVNEDTRRKDSESKEVEQNTVTSKLPKTRSPIRPLVRRASSVSFGAVGSNSQGQCSGSMNTERFPWRPRKNSSRWWIGHPSREFMGLVTSQHSDEDEDNSENEYNKRKQALERFKRAAHLVRVLSLLTLGIRRFAEHDKSRQYDLYYIRDMLPGNEDRPTVVQETSITFNKHLFSRDNTLHFPMWARWACAKEPEGRTEAEINKLVTLLRGMKSFGKFSREAQQNLCRTMTYACYERHRLIIRQGHPGFCFYFIVSGSVSVTVTRRDFKTGIYVTNTVDVLEKNDAFGEIALISDEARRTATIICRERVVIVNRETILKHCPDVFQREYEEKVHVLRTHPLFHGWKDESFKSLSFCSHIREFSCGKLVDIDSTASESVYFIIKGKLEMLRKVDLKAVEESDVTVSLFQDRPLPRPMTALPRKGVDTCFINVGSLQAKDAWDLMTLNAKESSGPGNILVSAGVRVLKVPKRKVVELSSRDQLETFDDTYCPRHRCLTEREVYRDYLAAQSWLEYRKKVVRSVMDLKAQRFIAHISCTAKGSSGWTAWPGKQT